MWNTSILKVWRHTTLSTSHTISIWSITNGFCSAHIVCPPEPCGWPAVFPTVLLPQWLVPVPWSTPADSWTQPVGSQGGSFSQSHTGTVGKTLRDTDCLHISANTKKVLCDFIYGNRKNMLERPLMSYTILPLDLWVDQLTVISAKFRINCTKKEPLWSLKCDLGHSFILRAVKLYLASLTAACMKCSALKDDWWTPRILFCGIACNYGDVDRSISISSKS